MGDGVLVKTLILSTGGCYGYTAWVHGLSDSDPHSKNTREQVQILLTHPFERRILMKLPFFLCKLFHRKYWKTTSGTMDAGDYDCPKCRTTIYLKIGKYSANRVKY
jgi:hypothetical protein